MNIYDISRLAGVSIATVSRVLNGSEKVSEATRRKVLAVMDQNGYTPNAFARGLGLNTMRTVGILCADSSDIYLARVIYLLERELWKNSYASMLCCTGYKLEEKEKYLQLLLSRNVDALILAGSQFIEEKDEDNAYLYDAAKKVPVFLLNGVLAGSGAYSVVCDDALAVKEMTDELLELGCKRPIFLYRSLSYSGKQKLSGQVIFSQPGRQRRRDSGRYRAVFDYVQRENFSRQSRHGDHRRSGNVRCFRFLRRNG